MSGVREWSSARRRKMRQQLAELQRGRCAYCGNPLGSDMTFDHVTPRLLGGETKRGNILLAHKACNVAKGARQPTASEIALARQHRRSA